MPTTGRPSRLDADNLVELKIILLQGALDAGFPEEQWTLKRISALIGEKFKVRLDPSQVRRILVDKLNWTHHKPEKKASERRERAIAHWVKNDWEHIKKNEKVPRTPSFLG